MVRDKQDDEDDSDDEQDRRVAAAGCFTAVRRVVSAIKRDKGVLQQILPVIYPLLAHSVSADGYIVLDEGLECLNTVINYAFNKKE